MSDTLRVGLVAEGVTDYEVLRAAIQAMINGQSFDLKLLQPEGSVAFGGAGNAGLFGGGWKGVYKWCLQAIDRGGGSLRDDPIYGTYDLLILHLDADVASEDPARDLIGPLTELDGILPCECDCPPARATTDALRAVILSWIGERETPPKTVFCTPSKSIEAWVVAICFPEDRPMSRAGWECFARPEGRLAQQPINRRFRKRREDYQARHDIFVAGWPRIVGLLPEASRFQAEFLGVVTTLPDQ